MISDNNLYDGVISMLDMKFVRENLSQVQEMLKNRCNALDLSSFTELEERR